MQLRRATRLALTAMFAAAGGVWSALAPADPLAADSDAYQVPWATNGQLLEVVAESGNVAYRNGAVWLGPGPVVLVTTRPHRAAALSASWIAAQPIDLRLELVDPPRRQGRGRIHHTLETRIAPAGPSQKKHWEAVLTPGRFSVQVAGGQADSVRWPTKPHQIYRIRMKIDPGKHQVALHNALLSETEFEPWFDGKSLDGWLPADPAESNPWVVEQGNLVCRGDKGTWLRSRETVRDFELRLQYRLPAGGNSGVYVRIPPDGRHHGTGAGVEIQILDDAAPRYAKLKPYQYSGSVYAIAPAWPRVGHRAGKWNTMTIRAVGSHYRIYHNGRLVVDADGWRYPALFERRREGHLGLQNHRSPVAYRHVRVRTLSAPRRSAAPPSRGAP